MLDQGVCYLTDLHSYILYIFHIRRDPQDTLYQLTIAHPQQKDIVVLWQISELCSLFFVLDITLIVFLYNNKKRGFMKNSLLNQLLCHNILESLTLSFKLNSYLLSSS